MGFFRREKRLTEYQLPEALRVSNERCRTMQTPEVLVWAEATCLTIDRKLHEWGERRDVDTIWDVHHHALQLIGMTQSLVERAGKIEFDRPPTT